MTVSSAFSNYATTSATKTDTSSAKAGTGLGSLGAGDFLKLLTAQMQQQDPTDPVDNKQMLAQMAQFSTLANSTEMGSTLTAIADKLDVLIAKTTTPSTAS